MIARTIIAMGDSLEIQVIAEGVENQGQLTCLIACGCHYGQGFYVSPAVNSEKVLQLINENNQQKSTKQIAFDEMDFLVMNA